MIIALVVVDNFEPLLHGKAPCFAPLGTESALEHLVRTVLRGPFGVTIVASPAEHSALVKEHLGGFAVQHVHSQAGQPLLAAALKFAADYRERWQKAMAAAQARFSSDDGQQKSKKAGGKKDWATLKGSADVKVRGLARSFDRDGVIVFPADRPAMSLELQAQMVEAFARESADKAQNARPIAQAVHNGVRGYPVIVDLPVAKEVEGLPASAKFDDWLLSQLSRIQDVPVQSAGAVSVLRTDEDLTAISRLLKLKAEP